MNPRHRRLLIPGLLVALLVVVVLASLTKDAEAATPGPVEVSSIADPRITESSGLALSRQHDDLAYTVNDSGNAAEIYAVRVSTGEVVGTTRIDSSSWWDVEALGLGPDGTLWIADTGDNDLIRTKPTLLAIDEPGTGDHTVRATEYRLKYPAGAEDIEAIAVNPEDGRIWLVPKRIGDAPILRLPADLIADGVTEVEDTGWRAMVTATDATFSPDGRRLHVRNYAEVESIDTATGEVVGEAGLPMQEQGETIAAEASGTTLLVGSEGLDQALIRIPVPVALEADATATPEALAEVSASADPDVSGPQPSWLFAGLAVAAVLGLVVLSRAARRVR